MCDTCDDSRFELIKKYKQKLLDATNIGDSPEEMAVIDNILFRFWQMGWLEKLELFGNSEQLNDTISRQVAITAIQKAYADTEGGMDKLAVWKNVGLTNALHIMQDLPSAQPEITYQTCSDALLKMWMDNVLTDGEYNRIMDKLNAHWGEGEEHGTSRAVLSQKPVR